MLLLDRAELNKVHGATPILSADMAQCFAVCVIAVGYLRPFPVEDARLGVAA